MRLLTSNPSHLMMVSIMWFLIHKASQVATLHNRSQHFCLLVCFKHFLISFFGVVMQSRFRDTKVLGLVICHFGNQIC